MAEGHSRVFSRSEGQLEKVTQDDEVGGVDGVAEHPQAFAQRGEDGGRCRRLDGGAVRRDFCEDAVEGT